MQIGGSLQSNLITRTQIGDHVKKLGHVDHVWISMGPHKLTLSRIQCSDCKRSTQANFVTHTTFGLKMIVHAPWRGRQTMLGSIKSTQTKHCHTYLGITSYVRKYLRKLKLSHTNQVGYKWIHTSQLSYSFKVGVQSNPAKPTLSSILN